MIESTSSPMETSNVVVRAVRVVRRSASHPELERFDDVLEVVDSEDEAVIEPRWKLCFAEYLSMCEGIVRVARNASVCDRLLTDISKVERGLIEFGEEGIDEYILCFGIDGAAFLLDYGQPEPQIRGDVSLVQLKIAIQVWRQYLSEPDRKTVEAPFPDERPSLSIGARSQLVGSPRTTQLYSFKIR